MPPNPSPTNSGTDENQSAKLLIENIFDFTSVTDYIIVIAIITFSALYLYILLRILSNKDFRRRLISNIEEINRATANFIGIFFGVKTKFNSQDIGIDRKIDEIKGLIESKSYTISEESESKIVDYFDNALKKDFSEQLQQSLLNFTKLELSKFVNTEAIEHLRRARYRLDTASSSVSVRGVVSLIIGILLAMGALWILKDMVSSLSEKEVDNSTTKAILFYSITRVSLAIFITFISYFFLSLYRRSLDEVKFYQNELTNIDLWSSSLSFAMQVEDPKVRAYFVARMLDIDRNQLALNSQAIAQGKSDTLKISDEILRTIIDKIPG